MRALKKLFGFPFELWALLITWLPGPVGQYLRFRYWRRRLKSLGKGSVIDVGVFIQGAAHVSVGEDTWIDRHVHILAGPAHAGRATKQLENPQFRGQAGEVTIGRGVHVAPFCILSGIGGLQIGDYVGVAAGSKIYSYSHHYRNLEERSDQSQYSFSPMARLDQQAMVSGPIVLGDHSAVGLHCIVLPGVTIGRGAWLASGASARGSLGEQVLGFQKGDLAERKFENLEIKV